MLQQHDARIHPLRAAALEGQFGIDLHPAAAFLADQCVVSQEHVVEEHFKKMHFADQVKDRAHRHAGQSQVDNELRQAFSPVLRLARRTH